jgi:hypothetical protein
VIWNVGGVDEVFESVRFELRLLTKVITELRYMTVTCTRYCRECGSASLEFQPGSWKFGRQKVEYDKSMSNRYKVNKEFKIEVQTISFYKK